MDAATIKEARRLLRDLILGGSAETSKGKVIAPKDEALVSLIERVAGHRIEETEAIPKVEGFTLKETHHVREKAGSTQGGSDLVERCGGEQGENPAGGPDA